MTERPDYLRMSPEVEGAQRRSELVQRMVRRVFFCAGDKNPPLELVAIRAEKAIDIWKHIPSDKLEQTVNRARAIHGGANLTIEKVKETWLTRGRKIRVSSEERDRRRRLAAEKAEREKAPDSFVRDFFASMESTFKDLNQTPQRSRS
jgi:hypothetical protein